MTRRRGLTLLVLSAALAAVPTTALGAKDDVVLVDRATGPAGAAADSDVFVSDVSADGRFVVFESFADNLSAEDDDTKRNIFLRDLETGTTTLVSRAASEVGAAADGNSFNPSVSADGRFVAFQSDAGNLSDEDGPRSDVFVRDMLRTEVILVSRATGVGGAGGDADSADAQISDDGRHVAFRSLADNLSDADVDSVDNLFVRDLLADTTALVSRATGPAGAGATASSGDVSLSADGRFVAFISGAANLSAEDDDGLTFPDDAFVRDVVAGTTTLASRATGPAGAVANGGAFGPRISADGRVVVWDTSATNLSDEDDDNTSEVFARDLLDGTTTLVSRADGPAGAAVSGGSGAPSASGRFVAFVSNDAGVSSEDADGVVSLVVRDLVSGRTTLVSRAPGAGGAGADGDAFLPRISADGRFVVFASDAENLSGDDSDAVTDIYRRDVTGPPPDTEDLDLLSRASGGAAGAGSPSSASTDPATSTDGRFTAFVSEADNLSSEDNDAVANVFVRDHLLGTTTLVSRANGATGAAANADSANPAISPDGNFVAFDTLAGNLSTEDTGVRDVFLRDLRGRGTQLVSRIGLIGAVANGASSNAVISAGGGFVAFESVAENLSPDDTARTLDVFVLDRGLGTTTLVSREDGAAGAGGDAASFAPAISADGRTIAFLSTAGNLSSSDGGSTQDVFVRDTATSQTSLVSRVSGAAGAGADASSIDLAISGDGRHVAFVSGADNLSGEDDDRHSNLFVRDLTAATTTLASRAAGASGAPADAPSFGPSLSSDGRRVAFSSTATNLSGSDADATGDVFVRDLLLGETRLASRVPGPGGPGGDRSSAGPSISADGRYVAFASAADNLSTEDVNGAGAVDVFRRDLGVPPAIVPPVTPPGPGPAQPAGGGPGPGGGAPPAAGGGGATPPTPPRAVNGAARTGVCAGRKATIVGTNGRDLIRGTAKADVIAALGGTDDVRGLGGNDVICLGGGNDRARGGGGNDRILGQGGDDRLEGQGGKDVLLGAGGIDTLLGGPGTDTATGGPRKDVCAAEKTTAC